MKKFIALVVLLCAVIFAPTVSAEMQPIQLYDQNASTLTQTLQRFGIKIWNMQYRVLDGYPAYMAYFGDNPYNRLVFLVDDDDSVVAAVGIVTQFELTDYPNYPTLLQAGNLMGVTWAVVGLSAEDIIKLSKEWEDYFSYAWTFNPQSTEYNKTFTAYSVTAGRLIETEISIKQINTRFGDVRIFIRALA